MSRDIAAMAFIEQQVLGLAAHDGSLENSARRVESQYGLPPGSLGTGLIWQTRSLSLLYTLVLFPKEYWELDQGDPIFREIDQRWSVNTVRVITPDKKFGNTVFGFVHRLRNALAHARIAFSGDDIEIWDTWKGREAYRARISREEAERFLAIVGSTLANLRNRVVH
ncbi:MAG: hypothetical protein OXP28_01425 [Gammaproteobacteria bacterium]|nr:hypothetical protein [bacterium]MDE0223778.1 hypothetical protein [Gammaproteobacteria bacterium]